MKNSRLIKILKTFSKEEFREFEKFAVSPYFSRGRNLVPFLNSLKKFYPEFDSDEFTNEHVFTKLFPGKKFNEKNSNAVINTFSHELIKMCEEFLAVSSFRNDINSKNYYLLDKLRQKKLYNDYERKYKDAVEYQEKNQGGSLYDFIDKYFLLNTFIEYCIEKRDFKKTFECIALQDETAVVFALTRAYRSFENKHLAPLGYNIQSVPNISENLIMNLDSEKMLKEINEKNSKYFPYLALNYWFYMISEYPGVDKYYYEFKKLVFENLHLFGHTEKYVLFCRLISYCIQKDNIIIGDKKFLKEEFEIYNKMLNIGIYKWSDKDDFSIYFFRNIVFSALDMNELDWLESFTNKYSNELAPDDRENMKNYAFANLNYARKNYGKALENILDIKLNFIHYKLDIKNLMFKIYYDMNLFESALSVLETMRQYIPTAKELSAMRKLKSKNFIKFAKELLKIKSSSGKITPDYLLNEIEKGENIGSKEWLMIKARELG